MAPRGAQLHGRDRCSGFLLPSQSDQDGSMQGSFCQHSHSDASDHFVPRHNHPDARRVDAPGFCILWGATRARDYPPVRRRLARPRL